MNLGATETLSQNQSLSKHRIDKNKLRLASIINAFTFVCAIFAMSFYQWAQITIQVQTSDNQTISIQIWSSLLYACYPNKCYITYQQILSQICQHTDIRCLAIFYQLDFLGKLCFSIIGFAFLLSSYDFIRIIKFSLGQITTKSKYFIQSNSAINFKNNFRSGLMILVYSIGLSLNFFGMSLLKVNSYYYGVSFWLFVSSLIVFIALSLYQNRKMSKIQKQELIIKLLQGQKQIIKSNTQDILSKQSNSDIFSI